MVESTLCFLPPPSFSSPPSSPFLLSHWERGTTTQQLYFPSSLPVLRTNMAACRRELVIVTSVFWHQVGTFEYVYYEESTTNYCSHLFIITLESMKLNTQSISGWINLPRFSFISLLCFSLKVKSRILDWSEASPRHFLCLSRCSFHTRNCWWSLRRARESPPWKPLNWLWSLTWENGNLKCPAKVRHGHWCQRWARRTEIKVLSSLAIEEKNN